LQFNRILSHAKWTKIVPFKNYHRMKCTTVQYFSSSTTTREITKRKTTYSLMRCICPMVGKAIIICNLAKMLLDSIRPWTSQKWVRIITIQDTPDKLSTNIALQFSTKEISPRIMEFRENQANSYSSTVATIWHLLKILVLALRRVVTWVDQILSKDTGIIEMVWRVLQIRAKWTITLLRTLVVDSHRWFKIILHKATSLATRAIEVAETIPVKETLKTFTNRLHQNTRT